MAGVAMVYNASISSVGEREREEFLLLNVHGGLYVDTDLRQELERHGLSYSVLDLSAVPYKELVDVVKDRLMEKSAKLNLILYGYTWILCIFYAFRGILESGKQAEVHIPLSLVDIETMVDVNLPRREIIRMLEESTQGLGAILAPYMDTMRFRGVTYRVYYNGVFQPELSNEQSANALITLRVTSNEHKLVALRHADTRLENHAYSGFMLLGLLLSFALISAVIGITRRTSFTVLIVDDDRAHGQTLAAVIETVSEEFTIMNATNAQEALQIISTQGTVDILITDSRMPGMTGHELAREVRTTHQTRIIMVSADPAEDPAEDLAEGILDAFLAKPVRAKELREALRELLSKIDKPNPEPPAEDQDAQANSLGMLGTLMYLWPALVIFAIATGFYIIFMIGKKHFKINAEAPAPDRNKGKAWKIISFVYQGTKLALIALVTVVLSQYNPHIALVSFWLFHFIFSLTEAKLSRAPPAYLLSAEAFRRAQIILLPFVWVVLFFEPLFGLWLATFTVIALQVILIWTPRTGAHFKLIPLQISL
jgi:CheY-like chemotaxis protein